MVKRNWDVFKVKKCMVFSLLLMSAGFHPGNFNNKNEMNDSNDSLFLFANNDVVQHWNSASSQVEGKLEHGSTTNCIKKDGNMILRWRSKTYWLSVKQMNSFKRASNGNIGNSGILSVIHWNAGSKLWSNKILELETLLSEKNPDICYISEANMWNVMEEEGRHITGYNLILPKSMTTYNHARIVLLVRESLQVQMLYDLMDAETATIWIRIGNTRRNQLVIGGIYRQHLLLGDMNRPDTRAELQNLQEERWCRIVRKWKSIGRKNNCVIIGDLNLDYLKWHSPPQNQESMVNRVKDIIETSGFVQLITSQTRSLRGQEDSLLDHVWTNCDRRTVKVI